MLLSKAEGIVFVKECKRTCIGKGFCLQASAQHSIAQHSALAAAAETMAACTCNCVGCDSANAMVSHSTVTCCPSHLMRSWSTANGGEAASRRMRHARALIIYEGGVPAKPMKAGGVGGALARCAVAGLSCESSGSNTVRCWVQNTSRNHYYLFPACAAAGTEAWQAERYWPNAAPTMPQTLWRCHVLP